MHLPSRRHLKWSAVPVLGAGIICFLLNAKPTVPRSSGPLNHQVYVWQRAYTPAVEDAIHHSASSFDTFVALVAEISWQKGQPRVARIKLDYEALKQSGKPIGLAIRIGAYSGPFSTDSPATNALKNLAKSVLAEARSVGLSVSELQIDFDCAESKLSGYQQWIESLRPICAADHVLLTMTALPSWLDRKAFPSLANAVDDFVIQVHSFKPPAGSDDSFKLCDPVAARDAVERASRIGRPFRVALPTYSYIACFDPGGKVLGISAEGPLPQWPASSRLRLINSDPADIASLIQGWTLDRPANLLGVIWYRLPVQGDVMNWRPQTLAAVIAGRSPSAKLVVHIEKADDGAREVRLSNDGDADASLASIVVVMDLGSATVAACDALAGFTCPSTDSSKARFESSPSLALRPLGPGDSVVVGWVRLAQETEVRGHVE